MRSSATLIDRWFTSLAVTLIAPLILAACSRSGPAPGAQIRGVAVDGAAIYQANCASCHGPNGQGEPNWKIPKEDGTYPAPPHSVDGHTWHHGDGTLFQIIKGGGDSLDIPNFKSNMPAFGGTLSDQEIIAVLDYIKNLWPEEQRAIQADISLRDPLPNP